jgi:hypothetical protein
MLVLNPGKSRIQPIFSAFRELGLFNTTFFGSSFIVIFLLEKAKQSDPQLSSWWIIAGIISYTVSAFYFGWFFTSILPRHYKRQAVIFYLQRRSMDISISVSMMIMDLIRKADAGDTNDRDRSVEEMIAICRKVKVYQKFSSNFERNEPSTDFYEYFSFVSEHINSLVEKILTFADVLTEEQIGILLNLEKDTNSPMTKNIKFSSGVINGEPAPAYIPDSYGHVIKKLRENSKALMNSMGIPGAVA